MKYFGWMVWAGVFFGAQAQASSAIPLEGKYRVADVVDFSELDGGEAAAQSQCLPAPVPGSVDADACGKEVSVFLAADRIAFAEASSSGLDSFLLMPPLFHRTWNCGFTSSSSERVPGDFCSAERVETNEGPVYLFPGSRGLSEGDQALRNAILTGSLTGLPIGASGLGFAIRVSGASVTIEATRTVTVLFKKNVFHTRYLLERE